MAKYVLAVDDERYIRRLVEVNLQRAGYRVSTAEDGHEALESIRRERPDLVGATLMAASPATRPLSMKRPQQV